LKPSRHKKLLGLALGEKSVLVAEVAAGGRAQIRRLAEMEYTEGVSLNQPLELGRALGKFLKDKGFTTSSAIVGIPIKWLLVRPKEVPNNADHKTLTTMLRLQAETEFSADIKDLVFEYAEGQAEGASKDVLLLATPQKYLAWAQEMGKAGNFEVVAVTPSVLALGRTTGAAISGDKTTGKEVLVLSVNQGGTEMAAQHGPASSALRHLRPLEPRPPFVSELRRTVSTLPPSAKGRELVIWDGVGLDGPALSQQVGMPVHCADLPTLGIDTSLAGANGDGRKFGAAVAVALMGLGNAGPVVDFLHSRLAAPKVSPIPKWAVPVALAVIAVGSAVYYGASNLSELQSQDDQYQAKLTDPAVTAQVTAAKKFVDMVTTAQAWHGGKPQYLACFLDLTLAIPEDYQTFITSLSIKEVTKAPGQSTSASAGNGSRMLTGSIQGKTPNDNQAAIIRDRLNQTAGFSGAKVADKTYVPRERLVTFTIEFSYDPSKPVHKTK
jgi:hypothetical protein